MRTRYPDASLQTNILFILLILLVYWYLGLFEVLGKRPVSVHMWAMCDRASVARNYEQISMDFVKPRVHETREKEGITGLEFPIMNYMAAICYKIFGFNEFWYRLIMLVTLTGGLIASFRITSQYLALPYALFPPLLLLANPVLTYYAASFLPDTAALGFIMLGWHFYFKSKGNYKSGDLVLITLFFSLASLVKVTSLIGVVVLLFLIMISYFQKTEILPVFRESRKLLLPVLFIFIITWLWYRYAGWLSSTQNGGLFLMELKTPGNLDEVKTTLQEIKKIWLPFYYYTGIRWFIVITALLLPLYIKQLDKQLFLITYGYWAGCLAFFGLMMEQFKNHDYYIITLLPALFFQTLLLLHVVQRLKVNKILSLALIVLIALGLNFSRKHQEFRYSENCWLYDWSRFKDYLDIESYVTSLGINHREKVISICDDSPNIALYYLNLRGWRLPPQASDEETIQILSYQPAYLISNDSAKTASPVFSGKLNKIGEKGNVRFYRINY
jgi:hypothetical protein